MKNYKSSAELIKDYKKVLGKTNNPFNGYILNLLSNPKELIMRYKKFPLLRLENNKGDWFFVWKNRSIKIENQYVKHEEIIEKLEELLDVEKS